MILGKPGASVKCGAAAAAPATSPTMTFGRTTERAHEAIGSSRSASQRIWRTQAGEERKERGRRGQGDGADTSPRKQGGGNREGGEISRCEEQRTTVPRPLPWR